MGKPQSKARCHCPFPGRDEHAANCSWTAIRPCCSAPPMTENQLDSKPLLCVVRFPPEWRNSITRLIHTGRFPSICVELALLACIASHKIMSAAPLDMTAPQRGEACHGKPQSPADERQ